MAAYNAAMDTRFPHRIVCLTEEPTEVLYALGQQDRIVGISGFTVRPPRARREKPKVSAFTSARHASSAVCGRIGASRRHRTSVIR